MLAQRSSNAFVCMRCQLRLSRARFPPAVARRHANFSISTRRRDAVDDNEAAAKPKTDAEKPEDICNDVEEAPRSLGKLRMRAGPRERIAPLEGVKSLGEDAGILMINENRRLPIIRIKPQSQPLPDLPVNEKASSILASLETDGARLSLDQIAERIEELRPETNSLPEEPNYIKEAAFSKIADTLKQGFTVQQLNYYFAKNNSPRKSQTTRAKPTKGTDTRSEWYPGTTPLKHRLRYDLKQKGAKSGPPKSVLVNRILRGQWDLVLIEELEAPGEIELYLEPWQTSLLDAGGRLAAGSVRLQC